MDAITFVSHVLKSFLNRSFEDGSEAVYKAPKLKSDGQDVRVFPNTCGYTVGEGTDRTKQIKLISTYSISIEVDSGRISTEHRRRVVDIQ